MGEHILHTDGVGSSILPARIFTFSFCVDAQLVIKNLQLLLKINVFSRSVTPVVGVFSLKISQKHQIVLVMSCNYLKRESLIHRLKEDDVFNQELYIIKHC